ncbi:hypothetical protein IGI04_025346 [Brassica rapa subsp. trilocularis]|uniref:CCHC-type domain-containing protein n=1 Tax=Brassica rapa subsp. trilocularis TaxID=1813537 RepID=A0ABQ7MBC2_BRACM|nr:hypothetical protein IGI04_025346 [Brassica rapa subsp. trilocularis]
MSGVSHFVNGSRKAFEAHLLRYQLMTLYLCVFESVTQTQVSVAARQDLRSRNPMARKIASDRFSYRDDPYRRDSHRTFRHNLSECSAKSVCWNCREPGHMSNSCTNEGICHSCGIAGHQAKDCTARHLPPAEERRPRGIRAQYREEEVVCRNCRQVGHMSRECTARLMICRNCGGRGHIAYECPSGRLVNHHHHYPLRPDPSG